MTYDSTLSCLTTIKIMVFLRRKKNSWNIAWWCIKVSRSQSNIRLWKWKSFIRCWKVSRPSSTACSFQGPLLKFIKIVGKTWKNKWRGFPLRVSILQQATTTLHRRKLRTKILKLRSFSMHFSIIWSAYEIPIMKVSKTSLKFTYKQSKKI